MVLEKISVLNFKNIQQADLQFSPNINCFLGNNGTGKTNLLDAIHYLSIGRSSLNVTDAQCVEHDADFFMLEGNYTVNDAKRETIVCSFKRGSGKCIKRNGKEYEKLSEHIGLLPVVIVSPQDTSLIHDSADERRRFMNSFLSQIDREYLNALVAYNRLLAERNKLLKDIGAYGDVLEIIDEQFAEKGNLIYRKRAEFIEQLAPLVSKYYRDISDDREDVMIEYRSKLSEKPMEELLREAYERDRIMEHTTVGIHRDDLFMTILGYPIRRYGSQGQQKCILISLKLAQFDIIKNLTGVRPILLLDDVFDKLDFMRVEKLIEIVSGEFFGQIFLTDSNKVRVETIVEKLSAESSLFTVAGGIIENTEFSI